MSTEAERNWLDQIKQSELSTAILAEEFVPVKSLSPKLTVDGGLYCFLYGESPQEGIAGYGNSPYKAMLDFNKNFYGQS